MKPLGIIFDLDGTLIAEGDTVQYIVPRPGAIEFLAWCKMRGHSLAIWTAARRGWADSVTRYLCRAVTCAISEIENNNNTHCDDSHTIDHRRHDKMCRGINCRQIFDFVWYCNKLKMQNLSVSQQKNEYGDCLWCKSYSSRCKRCCCSSSSISHCPCQYVKDLKKVWKKSKKSNANNFKLMKKERTLIVENTPQQCILNYGNAIYVPTYGDLRRRVDANIILFERFKLLILELEQADNVRSVQKCFCQKIGRPHACFEQSWLTRSLFDDEDSEESNNNYSQDLGFVL